MKSYAWYIRFPGSFYANGPIRFSKKVNEKELRQYIRESYKYDRLPNGFECWTTRD